MDAMLRNGTPSWSQLRELFYAMLPQLFEEAQTARGYAVSYRDFRVGCAGLAYNTKTAQWKIFKAANVKALPFGRPVCAEPIVVQAARAEGYDLIVGLAIVAEPQLDESSGVMLKTLTPCVECRTTLFVMGIHLQSFVATANPDLSIQEIRSFKQVLQAHG